MRILLVNLYSANNRGDLLIVQGTLEILKRVWPEAAITGMTTFRSSSLRYLSDDIDKYRQWVSPVIGNPSTVILSPTEAEQLSKPRLATHYLLSILRSGIGLALHQEHSGPPRSGELEISPRNFDLVVFVGGGYLHAQASFYPNLVGHLYPAFICRASKVPYMFLGESVSGTGKVPARILLRIAFRGASLVVFRDPISLDDASRQGLLARNPEKTMGFPDLSLALSDSLRSHRRVRSLKDTVTVGVAFRKWKFIQPDDGSVDELEVMAGALSRIKSRAPVRFVLIPFSKVTGSVIDDDLKACEELRETLSKRFAVHDVSILQTRVGDGLEELALAFERLDMNICIRMHATVFSAMLGIPSVTIEYEGHKSKGVCSYLGLSDYYVQTMNEDDLVNKTLSLLDNYEVTSSTVLECVDRAHDSLLSALVPVLKSVTPHVGGDRARQVARLTVVPASEDVLPRT